MNFHHIFHLVNAYDTIFGVLFREYISAFPEINNHQKGETAMSKRRKKKKYPATLKLLCTVTVLLLGAAGYTFGNDGITPISDTASQSAQGVYPPRGWSRPASSPDPAP